MAMRQSLHPVRNFMSVCIAIFALVQPAITQSSTADSITTSLTTASNSTISSVVPGTTTVSTTTAASAQVSTSSAASSSPAASVAQVNTTASSVQSSTSGASQVITSGTNNNSYSLTASTNATSTATTSAASTSASNETSAATTTTAVNSGGTATSSVNQTTSTVNGSTESTTIGSSISTLSTVSSSPAAGSTLNSSFNSEVITTPNSTASSISTSTNTTNTTMTTTAITTTTSATTTGVASPSTLAASVGRDYYQVSFRITNLNYISDYGSSGTASYNNLVQRVTNYFSLMLQSQAMQTILANWGGADQFNFSSGSVITTFRAAVKSGSTDANTFQTALKQAVNTTPSNGDITVDPNSVTVPSNGDTTVDTNSASVSTTSMAFPVWAIILIIIGGVIIFVVALVVGLIVYSRCTKSCRMKQANRQFGGFAPTERHQRSYGYSDEMPQQSRQRDYYGAPERRGSFEESGYDRGSRYLASANAPREAGSIGRSRGNGEAAEIELTNLSVMAPNESRRDGAGGAGLQQHSEPRVDNILDLLDFDADFGAGTSAGAGNANSRPVAAEARGPTDSGADWGHQNLGYYNDTTGGESSGRSLEMPTIPPPPPARPRNTNPFK